MLELFLITSCILFTAGAGRIVKTTSGSVQGKIIATENTELEAFLGIPYAEPPIGDLRFEAPLSKRPWPGILDATKLPPPCVQNVTVKAFFFPDVENMTEDCLYLNLWVPNFDDLQLKPIIIFIHGGAFFSGSSSMEFYDGATLAAYGNVIVASLNYRVGVLGFFSTFDESAKGNMGFKDMLLAVRWIKENARSFGGDPDLITLMGNSAGGMSATSVFLLTGDKPLCKRIIALSGSGYIPLHWLNNKQRLLTSAEKLSARVGCSRNGSDIGQNPQAVVECLKQVPFRELSNAEGALLKSIPFPFIPGSGYDIVPEIPIDYLRAGRLHLVDFLIGVNKDEGNLFLAIALPEYFGSVYGLNHYKFSKAMALQILPFMAKAMAQSNVKPIVKFYINNSRDYTEAVSNFIADYFINCGVVFLADFLSVLQRPTYFYKFNHRPSVSPHGEWMGTTHMDELYFVFGRPHQWPGNYTEEEIRLSRRVMDRVLAFVKSGNPNIPGEVEWPKYSHHKKEYLAIDVEDTIRSNPVKRCEFWRERFRAQIDD